MLVGGVDAAGEDALPQPGGCFGCGKFAQSEGWAAAADGDGGAVSPSAVVQGFAVYVEVPFGCLSAAGGLSGPVGDVVQGGEVRPWRRPRVAGAGGHDVSHSVRTTLVGWVSTRGLLGAFQPARGGRSPTSRQPAPRRLAPLSPACV